MPCTLKPSGSCQMPLIETRCGTSNCDSRFSYAVSVGLSLNTRSVKRDHVYATSAEKRVVNRFSSLNCAELYTLVPSSPYVRMLPNCGYGRSSCERGTIEPLKPVPGRRPWNGFATS